MTTTDIVAPTEEEIGAAAGQILGLYTGGMLSYMIDIGHSTGLLSAAAQGWATSQELATRAALTERYVREWLGAMVTGGLVDYDTERETYLLPPVRAAVLTDGPMNLAPMAQFGTHLAKHVHQVARAFREGGGVPYAEYRPEFTDVMDAASRTVYDNTLVEGCLPLVAGLTEQLGAGARVADVACGTGHALVLLAKAFPASTFVGYDFDQGAIARARAEAAGAELRNVTFEVRDVATLTVDEPFDVVFVFDAIHDQVAPATVLARIHDALAPGGLFFMKEPRAADRLEDNRANPMAPLMYSVSTLHCMTVSLAHDGAGIGTVFGEGLAREMLSDAGFTEIAVCEAPADPLNAVYTSRRPS
jgi:SAM-dependent methyltransferase